MATYSEATIQQGTYERRKWTVDYTNDLPTGVTVASGTAIHIPPSGTAATVTMGTASPYLTVTLGPLSVTGIHHLDVIGTFSDSQVSQTRIAFTVNYPTQTCRVGMADIITTLRGYTDTGPNDFTIGGVPYWSDAQLQTVCDRHRETFRFIEAVPFQTYPGGGSVAYYEYSIGYLNLESGTMLTVENAAGSDYGTAIYSVDYANGMITFTTDTTGSSVYCTGRAYDVNAAAADIWKMKAANASKYYDFSTDNHRISRSQITKQFLAMADYYDSLRNPNVIMVYREDTKP